MHSTLPQIDSEDDVVSAAKSSDDGRALIVRLFDTSHTGGKVSLHWPGWHPARLFLSNTGGEPLSKTSDEITIARYGRVMLRAEFE